MKMEIPDDAEEVSAELIGALAVLRDLLSGQDQQARSLAGVMASDMGYLIQMIKRQAELAHSIKFSPMPPSACNND